MLRRLRRLEHVPRWTIVPTIKRQSVAGHSFQVAAITVWLSDALAVPLTLPMLLAALQHDAEEAVTGDIPTPNKTLRGINPPKAKRTAEELIVKLADSLEALMFVTEEAALGNSTLTAIQNDIIDRATVTATDLVFVMGWERQADGRELFVAIASMLIRTLDPTLHPGMEK